MNAGAKLALTLPWSSLWKAVGVANYCGDFLLVGLMTARRSYRQFPLFYLYMAFSAAQDVILYGFLLTEKNPDSLASPFTFLYLQVYTNAPLMILGLLAIPEGMRRISGPGSRTYSRITTALFAVYAVLVVAPVLVIMARSTSQVNLSFLFNGFNAFWYACMVLRLGLAIVCAAVTRLFRLRWATYPACLLIGFVLNDAWLTALLANQWVDLAAINDPALTDLRQWLGWVLSPALYLLTVGAWTWGVWREPRVAPVVAGAPEISTGARQLEELKATMAIFQARNELVDRPSSSLP